ncbi:copper resistance protein CopC [Blastococcus saxobsidens]|uniref:Copper resistance protein CopC n=1 Tax=Blastococcus saxobsidens TaxID=138336 RepID=A0A6L9W2M2_9ACTN|nr:copper resistance protein CopC [Blastococcus saxobsidens]NEK85741.1 copper resistance protein CopC [Blastococcus saxobsidens]
MTASRSAGRERSRRRVGLLGLATAALVVGAAPSVALAHDGLVSSSPAPDGVVATAPATVELDFTGEPLPLGTQVLVTGPDGASVSEGPAEIRDTAVVQPLADPLPAGAYRVEWRSTSSDGHPLSGTYAFTVAGPATAAEPADGKAEPADGKAEPADGMAEPADGVAEAAASAEADDTSLPAVYPLAGIGLLGALGVLTARRLRRRP